MNNSGSGAGPNVSGSKGTTGPSTSKESCASNAGAAKTKGGATACGNTGKSGAQPNVSGSKGCG